MVGLAIGILLGVLAYDGANLDLECSRALRGCTVHKLLGSEFVPLKALGPATLHERKAGKSRRSKVVMTYYAVVALGLSKRTGPSGDALFTSDDLTEARSTAQAFNAFRAGSAERFELQRDGAALLFAFIAFALSLGLTAATVNVYGYSVQGGASPYVLLTPHAVTLQPLPFRQPTLLGGEGRQVHQPKKRWSLAALGSFEVHPEPGKEAYTLQAVSPDHGAHAVCTGPREVLESVADDLNIRVAFLRDRLESRPRRLQA